MAKDDFMVIAYKILAYLYECMKAGKTPDPADYSYSCSMFSIPESYWNSIMTDMISNGYIANANVVRTIGYSKIVTTPETRITMQGAEFLSENSTMAKVKSILGAGFDGILTGIISAL